MGIYKFSTTLSAAEGSMTPVSNYMTNYPYPLLDPTSTTPPIAVNDAWGIGGSYGTYGWLSQDWQFPALAITDFNALCAAIGIGLTTLSKRISVYTLKLQGTPPTYQTANVTIVYPRPSTPDCQIDRLRDARLYFNVTFRLLRIEFY